MRYCINCGNKMDDERFCTKCGTDNGPVQTRIQNRRNSNNIADNKSLHLLHINLPTFLYWAANIFFLIAAIILLKDTVSSAENMTAVFLLYPLGIIFAAAYFILGMWYTIPAAAFVLNGGSRKNRKVKSVAAVMLILTIVVCILYQVISKFSGMPDLVIKILRIFTIYQVNASKLIILDILTIAAAVIGAHIEQKGIR